MKLRLAAVLALGALALAACSDSSATSAPSQAAPTTAAVPSTSATTAASAPPAAVPRAIKLLIRPTSLGPTVTFNGLTVYRFESDSNNPPKSTCDGQCVVTWPPLLTDATPVEVDPTIDSAMVGILRRPDGTNQVTLNGWALYLFAKDTKPGDVNGEGVGGKWSAIGADGKPLRQK
jgi:predicted lipoprotein with Yx(FWY)xxD motif